MTQITAETTQVLQAILVLQKEGQFKAVQQELDQRPLASETLLEAAPELIFEGMRCPKIAAFYSNLAASTSACYLSLTSKISSYSHLEPHITNPQRLAQNICEVAPLEDIPNEVFPGRRPLTANVLCPPIANLLNRSPITDPTIQALLDPNNIQTATLRYPNWPYFMLRGLLSSEGRIPRQAAAITLFPQAWQKVCRTTQCGEPSIAEFARCRANRHRAEGVASVAILAPPEIGVDLASGYPGCEELHKLKTWNPTQEPMPLSATTLEKLSRWSAPITLHEWGIRPKVLQAIRKAKKAEAPSLWDATGTQLPMRSYTFEIRNRQIITHSIKTDWRLPPRAIGVAANACFIASPWRRALLGDANNELRALLKERGVKILFTVETGYLEHTLDLENKTPPQIAALHLAKSIVFNDHPEAALLRISQQLGNFDPQYREAVCAELMTAAKMVELRTLIRQNSQSDPDWHWTETVKTWLGPLGYEFEPQSLAHLL